MKDDDKNGALTRFGVLILPDPIEEKIGEPEKKEENKDEKQGENNGGDPNNFMFEPAASPKARAAHHRESLIGHTNSGSNSPTLPHNQQQQQQHHDQNQQQHHDQNQHEGFGHTYLTQQQGH